MITEILEHEHSSRFIKRTGRFDPYMCIIMLRKREKTDQEAGQENMNQ